MKRTYILQLLYCSILFADEQPNFQGSKIADTNSTIVDKNSVSHKTASFFGGIIDDVREFAADNNIIDKSNISPQ